MGKRAKGFWKRGKHGRFWQTRDPLSGERVSTGCSDLTAAQAWKAARERLAADPIEAAAASARLGEWCDALIKLKWEAGKQVKFYKQKLKPWRDQLGDDCPLGNMLPATFDAFVTHRRSTGASDHNTSKEVGVMLQVLRNAKRHGCFGGDLQALRPMHLGKSYTPRTRVLQPAELAALLSKLDPERAAFVALCVGLGLRRGEAFLLQRINIDFGDMVAHIPGTKTATSRRDVPILAPFVGLVRFGYSHLPLPPWSNYLRDMKRACLRAGIALCSANDLRRTHATLLRSAGVDRDVMRRLLGHGAESKMLETVYDKPTAAELGARVGDLSTLESRLAGQFSDSLRAREDSNLGPTAPEALGPSGQLGSIRNEDCQLRATGPRVARCRDGAKSTNESHASRTTSRLNAEPEIGPVGCPPSPFPHGANGPSRGVANG